MAHLPGYYVSLKDNLDKYLLTENDVRETVRKGVWVIPAPIYNGYIEPEVRAKTDIGLKANFSLLKKYRAKLAFPQQHPEHQRKCGQCHPQYRLPTVPPQHVERGDIGQQRESNQHAAQQNSQMGKIGSIHETVTTLFAIRVLIFVKKYHAFMLDIGFNQPIQIVQRLIG